MTPDETVEPLERDDVKAILDNIEHPDGLEPQAVVAFTVLEDDDGDCKVAGTTAIDRVDSDTVAHAIVTMMENIDPGVIHQVMQLVLARRFENSLKDLHDGLSDEDEEGETHD